MNPFYSTNNASQPIKLLAIETSTDACSVALNIDGVITETYQLKPRAHAQLILPMVANLLEEQSIHLSEIDVFAYGRGPGSFTGIRIASSVIQALAFGLQKPVVPISTLRALAQGAYEANRLKRVLATLDARMQEHYWGLFEVDEQGIMQAVSEEKLQPTNTLEKMIAEEVDIAVVTGYPHAKEIVLLAMAEYRLGHIISAVDALPVYIRDEVVKKL